MQIAVVNHSARLADRDVAIMVEACNRQVIECADAWNRTPTPVVFYATADGLPHANCRIMDIVDSLDVPGALGYHDDDLGIVYGRVLAQATPDDTSMTLSHECLEEMIDPSCDMWRPMPGGRSVALEVCDPVQADAYVIHVELFGVPHDVRVSNYILPRWFDPAVPGAFDAMLVLDEPFQMSPGGYMIVRDGNGSEANVFARAENDAGRWALGKRLANPDARILRRLHAR